MDAAAAGLGLEVEAFRPGYSELERELARVGPALLSASTPGGIVLYAVVRVNDVHAELLGPDGRSRRVPVEEVWRALRAGVDHYAEARTDRLLERARVGRSRRVQARDLILREQLARRRLDAGFIVGLPPSAPFALQLRESGLFARGFELALLHIAIQLLSLLSWWLVGKGALEGRLDRGWLLAWALLLATLAPLRVLASFRQGSAALEFARLLKRRLLVGALRLEPEQTRHQGFGQLLGRVIESEAVESLLTNGGIVSALAALELGVAGVVLGSGAGGAPSVLLLLGTSGLLALACRRSWQQVHRWTRARLDMTHGLVERMLGHRTRLAQEPTERWHLAEDAELASYASTSAALDRVSAWVTSLPRAWLVAGVLSLVPAFVAGAPAASLAVGLGGVLLAYAALGRLTLGATSLFSVLAAWKQARELFDAGGQSEPRTDPRIAAAPATTDSLSPVIDARSLRFGYGPDRGPVLADVDLRIMPREQLLVEGPSGGGKSTLGALLSGARAPDAGLLLLGGLDRPTLGARAWRQRVAAAPQFHENHVLGSSLAFNLLMGRAWPPRPGDLEDARAVCIELGLGPLLERMPGGLMQIVGETGWQLSHGERSRLFIARALLQESELVVLDESFAALDPQTLKSSFSCVLERAPTLLVIAHP
jgi:ATP-binding cassette subfamily B protein